MHATKPTARDLMQTDVVQIDVSMPISDARRTLDENAVSGAPVVDSNGNVVGVFSLRDVARAADAAEGMPDQGRPTYYFANPLEEPGDQDVDELYDKDDYSAQVLPSGTVADWITSDVISVAPSDSLQEVCRRMADNRVHRVLVLDHERLVGIVTTLDVVRHFATSG